MPSAEQARRQLANQEQARSRVAFGAKEGVARAEWFVDRISDVIRLNIERRMNIATKFLEDKVVANISTSVTRTLSTTGRVTVVARSKPGEYPRAETTRLMQTIFSEVREVAPGIVEGYVGTPLDYGAILETSVAMDRSFLRRTLAEEGVTIAGILTRPFEAV